MVQGTEMLFALFGGLAMFLYGMDRMSRALQRAAGDAMKRLLARLTATPLLGVLTGLAVTAVLQSSSAATVMVIGFVSAGLLELPRAVAVIYGINIGTTMTAQLIAFDAQQLVYPVLFAGFVIDFAARKARWQAVGHVPMRDKNKIYDEYRAACDALYNRLGRDRGNRSRFEDDPGEGVAAAGHPAGAGHDDGGAEQLGHHRPPAERGPAGRAGRHPQRAGPRRGGARPAGG